MTNHIILLRHGEAHKNLDDKHGGKGTCLTPKGIKQAKDIFYYLSIQYPWNQIRLFCSPVDQTRHTALILSTLFKTPFRIDERIKPFFMGVIDNLSSSEVQNKYPEIALSMSLWRNTKIEANELKIPQAEDLNQFWERGLSFLQEIKLSKNYNIVIGTRSVLTLLIHILKGNSICKGGGYKSINIPTASLFTFRYDAIKNKTILLNERCECRNKRFKSA